MESDAGNIVKLLRSRGYLAARVKPEMERGEETLTVIFDIDPGSPFRIANVSFPITSDETSSGLTLPVPAEIGLKTGTVLIYDSVLRSEKELIRSLKEKGFAFARVKKREVIADFSEESVEIIFHIDPGPRARFGPVTFTGLTDVKESYLRGLLTWQEGDIYSEAKLDQSRRKLAATGLFTMVEIKSAAAVDKTGCLPIEIRVREGASHSFAVSAGYNTDEGPGVRTSWEDRNILGGGEKVRVSLTYSENEYSGDVVFRKPSFRRPDQNLILTVRLGSDHPPAYDSRSLRYSAILERFVGPVLTLGGGLAFKQDHVTQFGETKDFSLLSWILYGELDARQQWGGNLSVREEIVYAIKREVVYYKGLVVYGHHLRIMADPLLTFDGRVTLGAIDSAAIEEIPADERFYAGGSGTVRGYSYQTVGPLRDDDPVGGRSLLALSAELSLEVIDSMGFALFIDGGSAFEKQYPSFNRDILWGTGIGLRYFSPIGPIGIDVATPLDPRTGIDSEYYIYVSAGSVF